jgi:hypothetical protein
VLRIIVSATGINKEVLDGSNSLLQIKPVIGRATLIIGRQLLPKLCFNPEFENKLVVSIQGFWEWLRPTLQRNNHGSGSASRRKRHIKALLWKNVVRDPTK